MAYTIDLAGKIALITGATRGLGYVMTRGFAAAGADVVVSSRKADACERVAEEIRSFGRRALALPCHVGYWDQIEALVERVYAEWGRIDILVNNAGMSPLAPSSVETSEVLFDKIMDINLKGPFRLAALVGSRMAAGDGGSIINISATAVTEVRPMYLPYAAAKAGVQILTKGFAREFAPKVRVNTISPGPFLTDVSDAWRDSPAGTLLQRYGEPDEILGAALYLASNASSFTSAANIEIAGGGH